LTKPNTSCTIEMPASLRSDGVRDHPGMLFGIILDLAFGFAGIPTEHAPNVIHNKPPSFLQPFMCDPQSGFHAGNMQISVKNVGNSKATHVVIMPGIMTVVPEKNGAPFEPLSCANKFDTGATDFSLAAGEEKTLNVRQMVMSIPKVVSDQLVQLYASTCVYYSGEVGSRHAACDTYRLFFQV
jgi:hypothetical protein